MIWIGQSAAKPIYWNVQRLERKLVGSSDPKREASLPSLENPLKGSPKRENKMQYQNTPYNVESDGSVFRNGKLLKQDVDPRGYCRVTFSIKGKTQRHLVHRLVAECFINNPDGYEYVNHIDNDPSNNDVSNLEWCNHSMNMIHCHKQGRCSNIIASKKASLNKLERATRKFKDLLKDNFINIEVINKDTIIYWNCIGCNRPMRSRIDSSAFKKPIPMCRYCR